MCIANVELLVVVNTVRKKAKHEHITEFPAFGISLWNKNSHHVASVLVLLPLVADEIQFSIYKSSAKSQEASLTKSKSRSILSVFF